MSGTNKEEDAAYFPELFKLFGKHYISGYLKMVITNAEKDRWFRPNSLVVYIKQQLYA